MGGSTVRLNEWEASTLKEIARVENVRRRKSGLKELKQSNVLHLVLDRELPTYLANASAAEEGTKQPLLL